MLARSLAFTDFQRNLGGSGVALQIGPFVVRIESRIKRVAMGIYQLYSDYPLVSCDFADFHVLLKSPNLLRSFFRPQVNYYEDGAIPFKPLPRCQALPMFEWGLNWSITSTVHRYLMLHAAVVEKCGKTLVLPAPPGSGKSTLCAGLVTRGWRLLSDEMALIHANTQERCANRNIELIPVTRPISLKNRSIEVIKEFAPDVVIGPETYDTSKGTVAHMKPPPDSVRRMRETAPPRWIVFPRYTSGASMLCSTMSKAEGLMRVLEQSFNSNVHGQAGFELLREVVSQVDVLEFEYSNLQDAVDYFDHLAENID